MSKETIPTDVRQGDILVVDDDKGVREVTAEVLRLEGYPVDTADNVTDAKRMLVEHQPPYLVAVTDVRMPDTDDASEECAGVIKAYGLPTKQLVLTAERIEANRHIGDAYLPKPYDLNNLLDAVADLAVSASAASTDEFIGHQ